MTAAYLDDCLSVTADEILEGFARYRRTEAAYPPTGPQLLKHAREARADRIAKDRTSQPKLSAPARGIDAVPEADRPAMKARIQEMLASWRAPEATQ